MGKATEMKVPCHCHWAGQGHEGSVVKKWHQWALRWLRQWTEMTGSVSSTTWPHENMGKSDARQKNYMHAATIIEIHHVSPYLYAFVISLLLAVLRTPSIL